MREQILSSIALGPYKVGLPYTRPTDGGENIPWKMSWEVLTQFRLASTNTNLPGPWAHVSEGILAPTDVLVLQVPHPIPGGVGGITRAMLGLSIPRTSMFLQFGLHSAAVPNLLINEYEPWGHFALFFGKGNLPKLILPVLLSEMDSFARILVHKTQRGFDTLKSLKATFVY